MTDVELLVGAATRVITPLFGERPVFLAGFQNDRRATGVHLDLCVRVLALRLGERECVLAVCDLLGLDRQDVEAIRRDLAQRGIDPKALVVACTHTHSGPDTIGLWGATHESSGVDPVYMVQVRRAVVDAAVEALTFCCPVRARFAMSRLPDFIINYRNPDVVDDEVAVMQFVKADGEVVATLLNLACHPEVLPGESSLLSSDYAGAACQAVEAAVGGTAIHVSGALGGMLSPGIEDRNTAGVERMGRAYASVVLDALANTPLLDVTHLDLRRATLTLPLQNPLFVMGQEIGILPRRSENNQLVTSCAYITLGPAQMITVPGELLPRLGFELKAALPGPYRVLIGLADDEIGYILPDDEFVTPADYANPGEQYEESMSPGPHTGSLIMQAARELIAGDSA